MRALLLAGLAALLPLQAQPLVQRFTLPNGLRVLHLEDHEHPLVRARLQVRLEPGDAPGGRRDLPQLLFRMLGRAETADLKAEALDRILEESGIQLRPALNAEGLSWRLVARSRDQDRAVGLLADRVQRTIFTPAALEAQRPAPGRPEGPEDSPRDRLRATLSGDPGVPPNPAPLTLETLLAFRARVLRPDRAVLVLHGDLGLEQAKRLVLLSLGAWTADASRPPVGGTAPQPPPTSPVRIPAPGRGLRIQALAAAPGDLTPEVAALLGLLVPGDANLLPLRVNLGDGHLLATLDQELGSGAGAWSLFQGRLAAYRARGFTQADLDRARRAWLAGRSLASLHPDAQMDSALAEALGRGVTEARMQALTLAQLNGGLGAWLDPAGFRIGAAGDPEDLKTLPPH